jgi:hypothetical protein
MPFPIAAAAILGGTGVLSSILGNRGKKVESGPTWTPEQRSAQSGLWGIINARLQNPKVDLGPQKTYAYGNVNKAFDQTGERLEAALTGRGFGRGGKFARTMGRNEVARSGALGSLESQFAQMALDEENKIIEQAMRFAFASPGQQTQYPGNMLGAGIGAGSETLTTLFMLDRLMNPGGGPGANPTVTTPDAIGEITYR